MALFLVARRMLAGVRRAHAVALLAVAVAIVLAGGVAFAATDHVDVGTGLYWSVTTATTVGYGDVTPHTTAARIIAVVVMLTTIPLVGAAFAIVAGASAVSRIRRLLGLDNALPDVPYTLVYGAHPVVPRVLEGLAAGDDPVVLVAPDKPPRMPAGVHYLAGDPTDEAVVKASEPGRANRALIACEADADTLIVAVSLRTSASGLELYALSESARVASALRDLGVTNTLSSTELVGHTLAKSLETPSAGSLLLRLVDSDRYTLRERAVDPALASRRLSQVRAESGSLVLGIARNGTVDLGVGDDPVLAAGDRLVEVVEVAAKGS